MLSTISPKISHASTNVVDTVHNASSLTAIAKATSSFLGSAEKCLPRLWRLECMILRALGGQLEL